MLHIILLILKIIGIVLLCVLGILILTILCLLYVPIRYRIEITRQEGEGQPPVAVWMKATWLLHFVNVLVRYPAELRARVRVMFFTIWRSSDGEDGDEQSSGKKKKKSEKKKASAKEESEEIKETAKEEDKSELLKREEDVQETASVQKKEEAVSSGEEDAESEKPPSFMDKLRVLPDVIKKIILKIKSLFQNIQYTIQGFCDKIKSISDNIQYYKEVVESDTFQNAYGLCKEELTAILKCLKPQKVEGNLIVGTDDPATTGKILAVCGMLYPVLGGHVDVAGDFERKRIEGRLFIKGRIRCFTLLRAAVRIYYNKDIKKVHRLLKKEAV